MAKQANKESYKHIPINKSVDASTEYKTLFEFKTAIFPLCEVDPDFLQRLLTIWSDEFKAKYLTGYYSGYRDIDPFVIVELDSILSVLNHYKESLAEADESDIGVIDEFINKLHGFKSRGKKYLMINGQHRKDTWTSFWNDEFTLNDKFPSLGDLDDVEGWTWSRFNEDEQLSLLRTEHLVVTVSKFKTMADLKNIVILHNEGNEWNANEKRIITPSYLASELYKLNEDEDFKVIFKPDKDKYSYHRKGIAFFLTQMYWSWANSTNYSQKNGDPLWYKIPNINDEKLDNLVELGSKLWSVGKVKKFKTLAKKIARGYSSYIRGLKTMKDSRGLSFKISTFRNYFLFRVALDVNKHSALSTRYTVNQESDFMTMWVIQEAGRMDAKNNLTKEGQSEWDKSDKHGLGLNQKRIKQLQKKYIDPNSYMWRLRGATQGESLQKVVGQQITDFKNSFTEYESKGVVNRQGSDLNKTITDQTLISAMSSRPLKSTSMEELLDLQDGSKTHIGHKKAKSKGGEPTLDNLEPQGQFYNQSQGNN